MHTDRISLVTPNNATAPIAVPDGVAAKITVDINDDADTYTWGVAVVDLQYSASLEQDRDGTDLTNWQNFSPTVQFVTGTRYRRSVGVTGAGNVRLFVTTADSGADDDAVVTIRTSWNA